MGKRKIRTDQLGSNISAEQVTAQHKAHDTQALSAEITYRPVPRIPDLPGEAYIPRHWRIQLVSEEGNVMGFDVYDDVVLGRGKRVRDRSGIDFTEWDAQDKGVSREHALLRPTPTCLYLVDIESTNGTFHNIEAVTPGIARELADGDVIVLGRLALVLRIVHSPHNELPLSILEYLPGIKTASPARTN